MPEINPVQSVSGQINNGNLKITVNGVESGDIPLPESVTEIVLDTAYYTGTVSSRSANSFTSGSIVKLSNVYIASDTIPIKAVNGVYIIRVGLRTTGYMGALVTPIEIINEGFINLDDGEYSVNYIAIPPGNLSGYIEAVTCTKTGNKITIPASVNILCNTDLSVNIWITGIRKVS